MISKSVKNFAIAGIALSAGFALIPIIIHFGRPYFFKDRVEAIRTEQLALQAQRKPTNSATPTPRSNSSLPKTFQLQVPFTSQAPTANWDELHNEACEEASVIMANAYFSGTKSLPAPDVEREISKMTNWQNNNFGYHLSIDTDETVKMIESVYDLNAETVTISENAIKKALSENKVVIIPANGQMLGNPNFRAPGPIYHMFVITGWNEKEFITNDPGTRKGHNYVYTYKTIYDATGNWNHGDHAVDLSDKRMIIVSK